MYLAYGSYSFPTGAVHISTRCSTEWSEMGAPISQTYTFSCRGTITAANQAAMATAILTMEAALRVRNQNLILYQDDSSESACVLKSSGSITGVRVLDLSYPTTEGPENATHRSFEVTFEAKYPYGILPDGTGAKENADTLAITFEETLSVSGGDAQFIHKPNKFGAWQKQLNYPQVPWVAVQSGTAVGIFGYPPVPPPIFPAALKNTKPKVSLKGPKQVGSMVRDYTVSWEYTYESTSPLVGLPHYWSGAASVRI